MRSNGYFGNFFATAVIASALLIGAGLLTAQPGKGKGHGKHGDRGGPPGHEKQEGRREGRQQQSGDWDGRRQKQRDDDSGRRQQNISDWNARRQQQISDSNARRQQQVSDWNSRWQQQWSDRNSRRRQEESDWNSRRQQQVSDWNSKRRQKSDDRYEKRQRQKYDWNARRYDNRNDRRYRRDDDNGRWERRRDRRIYSPVQVYNVWNGRQWGQWNAEMNRNRRDQKRAWKEERKVQRRYEKEQRRYARFGNRENNYNYYGDDNYYRDNSYYSDNDRYYDDDRSDWKQHLLRTVIANFLNGNGGDNSFNGLDNRYARRVYSEPAPAYYNSPLYVNYSPDNGYGQDYVDDGNFSDGSGFDLNSLLGQLPIQELVANYAGDGFVSELLGGFLSQGYDEGFLAGQSAREDGQGEQYFNDPYLFDNGIYDPYSSSLGDNRQLLSEGYALGYQDALNGRQGYDPQSEGNVDLVSLLLSNVLTRG